MAKKSGKPTIFQKLAASVTPSGRYIGGHRKKKTKKGGKK